MSWFGCGCKQDVAESSDEEDALDSSTRDLPLDVRRIHGMLVCDKIDCPVLVCTFGC
jgi:hypothetical protein